MAKPDPVIREKKPWPSYVASFLLNDMQGACKKRGLTFETSGVNPAHVGYLMQLNYDDHIDRREARASLEYMLDMAAEVNKFMDYVTLRLKNG